MARSSLTCVTGRRLLLSDLPPSRQYARISPQDVIVRKKHSPSSPLACCATADMLPSAIVFEAKPQRGWCASALPELVALLRRRAPFSSSPFRGRRTKSEQAKRRYAYSASASAQGGARRCRQFVPSLSAFRVCSVDQCAVPMLVSGVLGPIVLVVMVTCAFTVQFTDETEFAIM